jgi:hypothetical protein
MTQSLTERLSTLSLPDLSRDDIARGLAGLPTPDLSGIELPTIDLSEIDLRKIDLPNAVLGAATAVGLKRSGRPRWQFALGAAALLAAGTFVAINRRAVRARIDSAMGAIERQVAQIRSGGPGDEPVAFTAAETAPIEPSELTGETGSAYPDGLGNGAGTPTENGSEPQKRSAEKRSTEVVGV